MTRNQIMLIVSGVALVAAFGFGYHRGTVNQIEKFESDRQALQEEVLDLNGTLQQRAAEIAELRREKEGLIHDLENQARNAPGASNPGVAATGGLRRLEQRWGPRSTTSK